MHILILNWRDIKNPMCGGAEISLLHHAQYWKKQKASITWFSSSFTGALSEEIIDGITYIRRGSHFTVHLHALFYFLFQNKQVFDRVVDCFHFLPFFTPLYMRNVKIVALINEPAKNAWFKNIRFPISLLGYILEPLFFIPYRKTTFITGSETIAIELLKYHLSSEQVHVVHHGTELSDRKTQNTREKKLTLIFLAQVSPDKGIEDAIHALKIIKDSHKNAVLWIVGKERDSAYLYKVKELVKSLHLSSSVIFYGFVSKEEKFNLLSRSTLLVHPSVREGWGLNVIEGNSVGTPAVGYNIVGLRDSIKNGKTGILVNMNPHSLAEGILSLVSNNSLYQKLSTNARKWSQEFSWDKSGEKSWKILQ